MTFTSLIASRMRLASSRSRPFGFVSGGTPDRSQISLATRDEMRENSSSRNALSLYDFVSFAIARNVPSSTPYGWGLISMVFGGSSSVTRSKTIGSPSGGRNVIRACGFTIAVALRYSRGLCCAVMYRPLSGISTRVPCGLSHVTKSSSWMLGRFLRMSMIRSTSYATSISAGRDRMRVGLPVVVCP